MISAESSCYQTITYWHGLDTLAQSDGANVSYFEYDGLGSVRQLVDDAGEVRLAQTFDPYGNPYASAGAALTSLGFTGEQTDDNGFVFLRARYYNPALGRFFQTDPSRLEQNPYLYAIANPILHTDPSGKIVPFLIIVVIGGIIVGLVTAGGYDVMVNQGKGGWDNVVTGRIFDPTHYCDINWVQTAGYSAFGGVVGGIVAFTAGAIVQLIHTLSDEPPVNRDYEIAKSGGKHSGTYENYQDRPDTELSKAVKSYEEQVQEHEGKIANPKEHIPDWDNKDPREQEGLLRKWLKDLERNQELANVIRGILENERGQKPQ